MKNWPALILLMGSLLAALLLVGAPTLPEWGQRHLPHEGSRYLRLRQAESVRQSFVLEYERVDALAVQLAVESVPDTGALAIELTAGGTTALAEVPYRQVADDGVIIARFGAGQQGAVGEPASFRLTNISEMPVFVRWQIDDSIFPEGSLTYEPNELKQGDLAWQVRYQRLALGSRAVQFGYAASLLLAGGLAALVLSRGGKRESFLLPGEGKVAVGLFLVITSFYLMVTVRPGLWIGPSDFSKDVSYVAASSGALRSLAWPSWSHLTCGGMGLIGNPEASTLSLATVLALLFEAERALWITLSLEAGLAAVGTYLLARALRLARLSSLTAAAVVALSPTFAYKLVEGFSMLGGALAFAPWVLLGLIMAQRGRAMPWVPLGGLALVAIFWRGDVHVIVGLITVVVLWTMVESISRRSLRVWLAVLGIASIAWLGASVKLLPFLEQPELISTQVDPHVILISGQRLWDDMFLVLHDRGLTIPVEHGLPEHYGYVGAYLGIITVGLAGLGLWRKQRYRWHLLVSVIGLLILIDGQLYESVLRHQGLLAGLLRMPSRLTIVLLPLVGLLVASGLEEMRTRWRLDRRFIYVVVGLLVVDITWGTVTVFNDNLTTRSSELPVAASQPTLAVHENTAGPKRAHASQLLAAGYLLPQICGDQNNPPNFAKDIDQPTAVAQGTTILSPNRITLVQAHGTQIIQERYVSSWIAETGIARAGDSGEIIVEVGPAADSTVVLQYQMATLRVQQLLLVIILLLALSLAPSVRHYFVGSGRSRLP